MERCVWGGAGGGGPPAQQRGYGMARKRTLVQNDGYSKVPGAAQVVEELQRSSAAERDARARKAAAREGDLLAQLAAAQAAGTDGERVSALEARLAEVSSPARPISLLAFTRGC